MATVAARETDIQAEIQAEFEADPFVAWTMVTTTGRAKMKGYWTTLGKPGVPDILGQLVNGKLFGYEVKRPGEKPTDIQLAFIADINSNGGHASWGCSAIEAVRWLSSIKPVAEAPAPPAQRKGGSGAKGTRLPEDWELPEDWYAWAKQSRPEIDIRLEADKFKDYWLSKSGSNATKICWKRTWRNWIRSAFASRSKHETRQGSNNKDWIDQELF